LIFFFDTLVILTRDRPCYLSGLVPDQTRQPIRPLTPAKNDSGITARWREEMNGGPERIDEQALIAEITMVSTFSNRYADR
jgi:hypothetical protein